MCNRCIKSQQELYPLPTSKEALDSLNAQALAAGRLTTALGASAITSSAIATVQSARCDRVRKAMSLINDVSNIKSEKVKAAIRSLIADCAVDLLKLDGMTVEEYNTIVSFVRFSNDISLDDTSKRAVDELTVKLLGSLKTK